MDRERREADRIESPRFFTSFVGRRGLLTQVRQRLATSRVVTLTGPGGVGKTRLALRAADEVAGSHREGCWVVDVASVPAEALLAQAVAAALGLHVDVATPPGEDPAGLLADVIADRRSLLVLDGCEHVLDAAADLVGRLRAACPHLAILVTSRQRLRIAGEAVLQVPPLTTPDRGVTTAPEALSQFESVALFVDRAALASGDFQLTRDNADAVAELCTRLDGMPLAIELAAARIAVLSPREMLDRLTERFALLDQGYRDVPERHRSLHACVEWSHDLCPAEEQLLWHRMSVFVDGSVLDGVEAVCGGDGVEPRDVLGLLDSLVDRSVVAATHQGDGTVRYAMVAEIAEFGREKLRDASALDAMRERHARWCMGLAARLRADWVGGRQPELLRRARREHANLTAALEFCTRSLRMSGDGLGMATDLDSFWVTAGLADEARHWLQAGLEAGGGDPAERALAMVLAARFAALENDVPAATALLAGAATTAETADDDRARGLHLVLTAVLATWEWDLESAVDAAQRAVSLLRGDPAGELLALSVAGQCLGFAGNTSAAESAHREAIAKAEAANEVFRRSYSLSGLGELALDAAEPARAEELFTQALRMKVDLGDRMGIAVALDALSRGAAAQDRFQRAAVLLGASRSIWDAIGMRDTPNPFARPRQPATGIEELCAQLGTQEFRAAFRRGSALAETQAVDYALSDTLEVPATGPAQPSPLTRRETEIAELVAEGLSNPEIARRLVISVRTAQGHVENILRKLGFTSRTMIAAWVTHRRAQAEPVPGPS